MSARGRRPRRAALASWLALVALVGTWPLGGTGIGWLTTAIAGLPLLLPLAGLARGRPRTLRYAPLTLAPAVTLALTEVLVNPAARLRAAATLALILAAFALDVAALRATPARTAP